MTLDEIDAHSDEVTASAEGDRGRDAVQSAALAQLSAPGIDLAAARSTFTDRRGRRTLTRRVLGASTAASLLLAAGLVVLVGGDEDPDSVLADREEVVSSTTVSSTTVPMTAPVIEAPPETIAVVTTLTVPPTTAAPVETTPPTTLAPNQELTASLQVLTPTVEAGQPAGVAVMWSDPDLGSNAPRHIVSWGDPLLSTPVDVSGRAACDAPGPPASGTETLRFRYSTPGTYDVSVVVDTCDGLGAYAGRAEVHGSITVTPPRFVDPATPGAAGTPGRALVVFQPPFADATPWPALDRSSAQYVPASSPQSPVALAAPDSTPVFTTSGPATILIIPADSVGTVRLIWTEPASCATTSGTDLGGVDGAVLSLPLGVTAC